MRGADGKPFPVSLRGGTLWPGVLLPAGARVTVKVDVRRPSWIGWLVGRHDERTVTIVTPVARIRSTVLRPKSGSVVTVRFVQPVSSVAVGHERLTGLGGEQTAVPLGVRASRTAGAGTLTVSAAARRWERLSAPVRVSWFVAGTRNGIVSDPAVGRELRPNGTLTLTLAEPVADVLGSRLPKLEPATRGTWMKLDSHTLSFRPAGFGFGLGTTVHVRLPGRSLTWTVPAGSTLRLQELLARAGYLPLRWSSSVDPR